MKGSFMNTLLLTAAPAGEASLVDKIVDALVGFATTMGARLVGALLVLIIGFIVTNIVCKRIRNSSKLDKMLAKFLASFTNFGGKTLVVIIAISIMGVEMSSVVALIASAGVAIGLALQGSLSNIAGGILLVIFKPFKVGDWVTIDGHSGTVSDLNLFYTYLKTGDNSVVCIPNATSSNTSLVNVSVNDTRRVDFTVSVAYGTDVDFVKKLLLAVASSHELTLSDPAPMCRLATFNESSIDFTLRVWVKSSDYWTVKFDINEDIDKVFKNQNIEIPFPQIDVHIKDNKSEE